MMTEDVSIRLDRVSRCGAEVLVALSPFVALSHRKHTRRAQSGCGARHRGKKVPREAIDPLTKIVVEEKRSTESEFLFGFDTTWTNDGATEEEWEMFSQSGRLRLISFFFEPRSTNASATSFDAREWLAFHPTFPNTKITKKESCAPRSMGKKFFFLQQNTNSNGSVR
jgi:hypothetical protein